MTEWIGKQIISILSFDSPFITRLIVLGSVLHTKQVDWISQITSLSEYMAQVQMSAAR
jgi:hypothetical protein